MVSSWGSWRPFPDPQTGGHIEAPVGPGMYEVRHTDTGAVVAFGHSGNVAQSLATMAPSPKARLFRSFRKSLPHKTNELEYRTCSAASTGEAKSAAEHLRVQREAFWRRRRMTPA